MAEGDVVLFTSAELARINAAIQEKAGGYKPCWSCGHTSWTVFPGLADIVVRPKSLTGSAQQPASTGTYNLVLICSTCGNTAFLNVFVLGLQDIFGVKSRAEELAEERAAKAKQDQTQSEKVGQ